MPKLAVNGGSPIKKEIGSYTKWPLGTEEKKKALIEVLNTGVWGTLGPKVNEFNEKWSRYCHTKYSVAISSGSSALELILRGLGIGRGDEVIVPPYTFCATISAVIMCGAIPVFADIDSNTYTISPDDVERVITEKTKAVIGVHLGGRMFDGDRLSEIAQKHNIALIEDAAHAHGSEWDSRRAGSVGTAGAFSFQETKNIACGEGGAVTTNDEKLFKSVWSLHNCGRDYDRNSAFNHPYLGINQRMTEWQAAVLCEELETLGYGIKKRMENAAYLDKNLSTFPFIETMKKYKKETANSLHLYLFKYKKEGGLGVSRETFINALRVENVCYPATGYSLPVYETPMMYEKSFEKNTGRIFTNPKHELPNNELAAYNEGMWLYHSQLLGEKADMDAIISAVEKIWANKNELK